MIAASAVERLRLGLDNGAYAQPLAAPQAVEALLAAAAAVRASDVHLLPGPAGLDVRWRIDGVLQPVGVFPASVSANVVARLKVLAELLTYRSDVPQEGRLRGTAASADVRLSTFPTLHGEKAVLRLFTEPTERRRLAELGLPTEIERRLGQLLGETAGAILVCGPAGSGKTTTLYSCLRELTVREEGRRNLATLEDPIEVEIPGVSQSQVNPAAGFGLADGLKHLMRQDPEVILLSEIRDAATAELALQTALTGHLLLASFHAGSAAEAVARLLDMKLEPFVIRTTLRAVIHQRLVRRLCVCARPARDDEFLGLDVQQARAAVGCDQCACTGYRGRALLAEMLSLDSVEMAAAAHAAADADALDAAAREAGMTGRWQRACQAVEAGLTSPAEVRRVLGWPRGKADTGAASQSQDTLAEDAP